MSFEKLPRHWQRIFELEWLSVINGSKAIAAVITDEQGNIISEGRNMTGEAVVPNPAAAHAETEAIRGLDTSKYPHKHSYTLYAGLEPCIMCMGTLVMGGIRRVVIAARDDFGGAMELIRYSPFASGKNIQITWADNSLGDMQRGFQTIRELIYNEDPVKLGRMLEDFCVHNRTGVDAAKILVESGGFKSSALSGITAAQVYNRLEEIMDSGG
ncbi:MAG: nucleoside deaminase [Ruminococcus sp.]|nr:nucleoside deaminase [Ruminococcus sp.]